MKINVKKNVSECHNCPFPSYRDNTTIFCTACAKRLLKQITGTQVKFKPKIDKEKSYAKFKQQTSM